MKRLQQALAGSEFRLEARLARLPQASELIESINPDVLLLDFASRQAATRGELASLAAISPTVRVVALLSRPPASLQLLQAGVLGLLPPDVGSRELAAALRAAFAHLVVIHPDLLPEGVPNRPPDSFSPFPSFPHFSHLDDHSNPAGRGQPTMDDTRALGDPPEERLTPRESEVLQMMGEGYSNKEIAGLLSLSDHTVKFHVSSILSKLGVESRTEATIEGIRRGLIIL